MKRHWYQSNLFKAFWISTLVVVLYYSFFIHSEFFQTRILGFQDTITQAVYFEKSSSHKADPLVLVTIDNDDFKKVRKWPWPRSLFAQFLNQLNQYEPKVVFFDIIFHGESPSGLKDDALLVDAIAAKGNVVLASFFDKEWHYQTPHEKFLNVAFDVGFVNKPRDLDLVVRRSRALVFNNEGGVVDLGAEIKVVCKYLDIPLTEMYLHPDFIELRRSNSESIHIPIDSQGTLPIDFTVSRENIQTIPFWKILQGEVSKESLKDKIVLISITSEAFHDQFNTPTHEDQPGVVIGANVVQMLLKNKFLKQLPEKFVFIMIYFSVFIVCFITLRFVWWVSLSSTLFFIVGTITGAYFLRYHLFQFDFFTPLFLIGFVFISMTLYNYFKLLIRNSKLRQLAITDGLTGMYIYRYLVVRLKSELERAERYKMELSFIIADIDHFKGFNDTYGHDVGNVVLKNFSDIIKKNSRKTDFIARYGGEEFCLLLPHTPQDKAAQLADKLRQAIESFAFPGPEGPLQVTASFGVSSVKSGEIDTVKKLFTSADAALYRAKETGRNRVCSFDLTQDKLPEEAEEVDEDDFSVPLD